MRLRRLAFTFAAVFAVPAAILASTEVVISVKEQTMSVWRDRRHAAQYPVSTSKFGVGDTPGSYRTPLGIFRVERKVGDGAPAGSVFKELRLTGEVVPARAPGRDPIVTRVLCLRGVETRNGHALARGIFIHGTPEEQHIGRPASYGCIRMRSHDVIALYAAVPVGARVLITDAPVALAAMTAAADADWFR